MKKVVPKQEEPLSSSTGSEMNNACYELLRRVSKATGITNKDELLTEVKSIYAILQDETDMPSNILFNYKRAILLIQSKGFDYVNFMIESKIDPSEEDFDDTDIQNMFETGVNFYQDGIYDGAYRCFSSAAQYGHAGALYNAGICLCTGRGTRVNLSLACKYMSLALDRGVKEAKKALKVIENISQFNS